MKKIINKIKNEIRWRAFRIFWNCLRKFRPEVVDGVLDDIEEAEERMFNAEEDRPLRYYLEQINRERGLV